MADSLTKEIRLREKSIEAFSLKIDKFLKTNLKKILKDLKEKKVSAIETASILGNIDKELRNAGIQDRLSDITQIYADELRNIREEFSRQRNINVFSDTDKTTINTLINFDTTKVTTKISGLVDDVRSTLMRQVIAGDTSGIDDLIDSRTDSLSGNLETELNTLTSAFSRTVTATKAQELGFDLMIYLGPDDKITRDFCAELLSKDPPIYKISEIKQMNNGQDLDVLTYCGGYNCRHQWRPISRESALEMGYDG